MVIGVIAEGKGDQEVIGKILKAFGVDSSDIRHLLPADATGSLQRDETDINKPENLTIGTFQGVKNACVSGDIFAKFFLIEGNEYLVIHLDTAEIESQGFAFKKPQKGQERLDEYSTDLRKQVIELIDEWLDNKHKDQLLYAIAIEEMEAWLLTCFCATGATDTANAADPKDKLAFMQARNSSIQPLKLLSKKKTLNKLLIYNCSMNDFVKSLEQAIKKN